MSYKGILDRQLPKGRDEVSLSAFAFLFSEIIQYCQSTVSNVSELERRLEGIGFGVGLRLLELLVYRDRANRREVQLLKQLVFLQTTLWKYLFGHEAQDLEQSNTADDEYMLSDTNLFVNRSISVPKDLGTLNCAAFIAGVLKGALQGAGFPARVTAHFVATKEGPKVKTTFLMKFDASVLQREARPAQS